MAIPRKGKLGIGVGQSGERPPYRFYPRYYLRGRRRGQLRDYRTDPDENGNILSLPASTDPDTIPLYSEFQEPTPGPYLSLQVDRGEAATPQPGQPAIPNRLYLLAEDGEISNYLQWRDFK